MNSKLFPPHTVSWLNSSVTLLVSKAPLNRTVKNGCFWVDPPFRFRVQKANFAFLFSGGLKKKADPLINFPLLTKSVTWDTVWPAKYCWTLRRNITLMQKIFPHQWTLTSHSWFTGTHLLACPTSTALLQKLPQTTVAWCDCSYFFLLPNSQLHWHQIGKRPNQWNVKCSFRPTKLQCSGQALLAGSCA